jgi:competence protein ComEC
MAMSGLLWLALTTRVLSGAGVGVLWIDVGQGSAMLARGPAGHVVLVDSGPSGGAEAIVGALSRLQVESVALWVHTHFDADHAGGISRVLAGEDGVAGTDDDVALVEAWDRGPEAAPATTVVSEYLRATGRVRRTAGPGSLWQAPGMWLRVLDPGPVGGQEAENERGLAICLRIGGRVLLLPGDLPVKRVIRAAGGCAPVDVLWASHHGSRDGISPELLALADPRHVVITAGMNNPYCHPSGQTLALLSGRSVWITGAAGLGASGACEAIATHLAAGQRVVAGDLWLGVAADEP